MSGERPDFPTARDVADAREEQMELRMHTAMPGRVQSYDPALQVADIVPLIQQQVPQPDGSYALEDLPILAHTPVVFPRMGNWFLSFPVSPGDTGLVIACESAIGHWWAGNGDLASPGDLRRFHLAHAIFLPLGLVPRGKALQRAGDAGTSGSGKPTGLVLGSEEQGPRILMRANGSVDIVTGSDGLGNAVAVRVDADQTVHLGSSTGGFVALASLVEQNFNTLKSAISGAAVVAGDGGASFKAALMAALSSWPISSAATKAKAT